MIKDHHEAVVKRWKEEIDTLLVYVSVCLVPEGLMLKACVGRAGFSLPCSPRST